MDIYISHKTNMPTLRQLANHIKHMGILCNIFAFDSVVNNKKNNKLNVEKGFKIVLFDDNILNADEIVYFCQKMYKINCAWIDTLNYHGCIMHHPDTKIIGECSEYD